jgi:hypothetical protein
MSLAAQFSIPAQPTGPEHTIYELHPVFFGVKS